MRRIRPSFVFFVVFLVTGFWIYLQMHINVVNPSDGMASLSEFASQASKKNHSPLGVTLVSRQQIAQEVVDQESNNKTEARRFQKVQTKTISTAKQSSKAHDFEKLIKFRSDKAFNLKTRETAFYLLEGINAVQNIRLEERELKSANAIRFKEFTITESKKIGGLRVAIASDNNDIVVLSGLISIKVNKTSTLELIAEKYALKPERIFRHLGLGYFKPSSDLIETYQRLQADPEIKEATFEIVEERMQKQ